MRIQLNSVKLDIQLAKYVCVYIYIYEMILATFILENCFFIKMLFMFMCNKFIILLVVLTSDIVILINIAYINKSSLESLIIFRV